jgi:hypothetical protein
MLHIVYSDRELSSCQKKCRDAVRRLDPRGNRTGLPKKQAAL